MPYSLRKDYAALMAICKAKTKSRRGPPKNLSRILGIVAFAALVWLVGFGVWKVPAAQSARVADKAPTLKAQIIAIRRNGKPQITVSALFTDNQGLELERLGPDGEVIQRWPVLHGATITDELAESAGELRYRLRRGNGEVGAEVLLPALASGGEIELVAATNKRAFVRLRVDGATIDAVLPLGGRIQALSRDATGGLILIESEARLQELALAPTQISRRGELFLSAPKGEPLLGIDDGNLKVEVERRNRGASEAMIATILLGEQEFRLEAGQTLPLPLHKRVK